MKPIEFFTAGVVVGIFICMIAEGCLMAYKEWKKNRRTLR